MPHNPDLPRSMRGYGEREFAPDYKYTPSQTAFVRGIMARLSALSDALTRDARCSLRRGVGHGRRLSAPEMAARL